METPPLLLLNLHAPLLYAQAPSLSLFDGTLVKDEAAGELLFCFELDYQQAQRIDPDPDCFPGKLLRAGRKVQTEGDGQGNILLPAGRYVFVQQRRALDRKECAYLAMEQQKDGLWERHKLDNHLYIRFLYEDDSAVTQLFRPCA